MTLRYLVLPLTISLRSRIKLMNHAEKHHTNFTPCAVYDLFYQKKKPGYLRMLLIVVGFFTLL